MTRSTRFVLGLAILALPLWTSGGHGQVLPERTAVAGLRIDGETELFTGIDRVYASPNGKLYVPQLADQSVWVFSAAGKRVGAIGRRGKGPGEFNMSLVGEYGWLGDSLWAYDSGNRRLTLFGVDGQLIRTEPMPINLRQNTVASNGKTLTMDLFAIHAYLTGGIGVGRADYSVVDSAAGTTTRESYIARLDKNGIVQKRLSRFPEFPPSRAEVHIGNVTYSTMIPFSSGIATEASRHGEYVGLMKVTWPTPTVAAINVLVMRSNGDTAFAKSVSVKGIPIPRRVIDSAKTVALTRVTTRPDIGARIAPGDNSTQSASVQGAVTKALDKAMPSNFVPVRGLHISDDGSVWLRVRTGIDTYSYTVLNNRGQAAFTVRLPKNAMLAYAERDTVWAVEKNGDDVPSVVRYVLAPMRK